MTMFEGETLHSAGIQPGLAPSQRVNSIDGCAPPKPSKFADMVKPQLPWGQVTITAGHYALRANEIDQLHTDSHPLPEYDVETI